MSDSLPIPVVRGAVPGPDDPEYREREKYESGAAEEEVRRNIGPGADAWVEVVNRCEPGAGPCLDFVLAHPMLARRIRGSVIDLGAGTCWATAKLSLHPGVEKVVALDLAAGFLTRIGDGVIRHHKGERSKIVFAESSFERTPFAPKSFDAAFLIGAIHHALAPIKVLIEARRILAPNGVLVIVESPTSTIGIARSRRWALKESRETGATEIAYTRDQLEYLLAHADFGHIEFHPIGKPSPNPLKHWIRMALRYLGIEHIFLSVAYVVIAEPATSTATP